MKKLSTLLFALTVCVYTAHTQDMAMASIGHNVSSFEGTTGVPTNPTHAKSSKNIFKFSYVAGTEEICAISPREKGTTYRIQFTAKDKIDQSLEAYEDLLPIGDIYPEFVFNKKATRYMLGDFTYFGDATYTLEKVWASGYEHAFIVTYVDGFRSVE